MKIHYLNGPQAGRRVELSAEGATIGREQDNQIQLLIGGVSRYHAKIEHKDDGWFLRDLGSTNGTKINDTVIAGPTKLNHGDHVVIGDQQFRIELLAHAPAAAAVSDTDADSTRAFPAPEPTSPAFVFRPDVMPPSQPPPPPVSPAAPETPQPNPASAPAPKEPSPEETPDQTLKVNFDDKDIFKSESGFGGTQPQENKKKSRNTLIGNIIFAVILVIMITIGAVLIKNAMTDPADKNAQGKNADANAGKKAAQDSFFFYYERVIEDKNSQNPNIFKVTAEGEYKFRKVKEKGKNKGKDTLKKYFELKVSLRDLANNQKFDSIPLTDISLEKVESLRNRLEEEILESTLQSSAPTGDSCYDRIVVAVNGDMKDVIYYNGDGQNNSYFGTAQDALDDFISDAIGMPLMMTKEEIVKEAEKAYNEAINAGNYQDSPHIFHRAFNAYERACLYYERLNSPRLSECKAKYVELEKYYKDKYRNGKNEVDRYYKDRQFQRASDLCDEHMKFFPEGTREYNFFRESKITINGARRKFEKK